VADDGAGTAKKSKLDKNTTRPSHDFIFGVSSQLSGFLII
jgi:hypothetical protein